MTGPCWSVTTASSRSDTRAELVAAHPSEEVRDFGLAVLMPGFVDLHTHLEYSVFRGAVDDVPYTAWKMQVQNKEARLSAEDWMDSAVLGAMEAVGSGITTIADITNSGNSVRAAKDIGLSGVVYREVSTMDKSQVAGRMGQAASDIEAWSETAADAADRDRHRPALALHVPPVAVHRRRGAGHRARPAGGDPPGRLARRVRLRALRVVEPGPGLPRAVGLA